jgi:hypothetical protein
MRGKRNIVLVSPFVRDRSSFDYDHCYVLSAAVACRYTLPPYPGVGWKVKVLQISSNLYSYLKCTFVHYALVSEVKHINGWAIVFSLSKLVFSLIFFL